VTAPATYRPALVKKKNYLKKKCNMTPNALNINMHIVHKTLLKSLQKHCQTVFSGFLSTTIFVPAEIE
jgi:hypothetical protein